jgi:hypothetical protein
MLLLLWFITPPFDDDLITSTFDKYFYVMRYFVHFCVCLCDDYYSLYFL